MIAGLLLVSLLVWREVLRATDPDAPATRTAGRLLVPVAVASALVIALRVAELAVNRA